MPSSDPVPEWLFLNRPWPQRSYDRRRHFQKLFQALYTQVLHGCKNPDCQNSVCATYRKRRSKERFRSYTASTARTIALRLASESHPGRLLCVGGDACRAEHSKSTVATDSHGTEQGSSGSFKTHSKELTNSESNLDNCLQNGNVTRSCTGASSESVENGHKCRSPLPPEKSPATTSKRDVKSFAQTLCDTASMKNLELVTLPPLGRGSCYDCGQSYTKNCEILRVRDTIERRPSDARGTTIQVHMLHQGDFQPTFQAERSFSTTRSSGSGGNSHAKCSTTYQILTSMVSDTSFPLHPGTLLRLTPQSGRPLITSSSRFKPSVHKAFRQMHAGIQTLMHEEGRLGRPSALAPLLCLDVPLRLMKDKESLEACGRAINLVSSSRAILLSFIAQVPNSNERLYSESFIDMFRTLLPSDFPEYLKTDIFTGLWQVCKSIMPPSTRCVDIGRSSHAGSPILPFSDPDNEVCRDKAQATHICKFAMAALVSSVFRDSLSKPVCWSTTQKFRKLGWVTVPVGKDDDKTLPLLREGILSFVDIFENKVALSVVRRLCEALACHNHVPILERNALSQENASTSFHMVDLLEDVVWALTGDLKVRFSPTPSCRMTYPAATEDGANKSDDAAKRDRMLGRGLEVLIEWLRGVIMQDWNGKEEFQKLSPIGGALDLLASIYSHHAGRYVSCAILETPFLSQRLDTLEMPLHWMERRPQKNICHILDYPFLFPPSALVSYFRAICHDFMITAHRKAVATQHLANRLTFGKSLFARGDLDTRGQMRLVKRLSRLTDEYLVLNIKRASVLDGAFDQLWRREKHELQRPLRVVLGYGEGEEGADHGGVQLEFFRIAFAEATDPAYGIFTTDPVTHMMWFQPDSFEPLYKFEMLGLLMSLAIYNGLTLPVTFPLAFYMKLLKHDPIHLEDIDDGWPDLARGMRELRDWNGDDVEEVFGREYMFSVEAFGKVRDTDMAAHETDISSSQNPSLEPEAPMVTNENRHQYIRDYVRHLTTISIAPQFDAFAKGFKTVINPKSLSLFTSTALQTLVQGVPSIRTADLEAVTRYEDGYSSSHRVIRNFWSIVHAWGSPPHAETPGPPSLSWIAAQEYEEAELAGQEKVRRLLEFVTASERLPAGGESRVSFVIQRIAVDDEQLPKSMTCFGRLLLPEYSTKDVLKERLEKAIEYAKGFGMS